MLTHHQGEQDCKETLSMALIANGEQEQKTNELCV